MSTPNQISGRGLAAVNFHDTNKRAGVLVESNYAEEPRVWLGLDTEEKLHLNMRQVEELLPYLELFARTGRLSSSPQEEAVDLAAVQRAKERLAAIVHLEPAGSAVRRHVSMAEGTVLRFFGVLGNGAIFYDEEEGLLLQWVFGSWTYLIEIANNGNITRLCGLIVETRATVLPNLRDKSDPITIALEWLMEQKALRTK